MDLSLEGANFSTYGLDPRLLQGVADLQFVKPTVVQAACIPLALRGKDVLARAQTGTGKTAAYALPVIQKILNDKKTLEVPHVRAVVLVPTRDLCNQVQTMCRGFLAHLKREVTVFSLAAETKLNDRLAMLKAKPDILIATAGALFQHLASMTLDLSQLLAFVIDEADLVLSECTQIANLKQHIPVSCQVMMLSATLTSQVMLIKNKIMNSPFVVKLQEEDDAPLRVKQYYIMCTDKQKYMALLGMLTVGDIQGKSIIFVNTVFNATKLRLFLDLFKVPAAVLSSAVPENSRNHIVQQFNAGQFTHLIATDESLRMDDVSRRKAEMEAGVKPEAAAAEEDDEPRKRKRSQSSLSHYPNEGKRRRLQDKIEKIRSESAEEYGVHRGIDFKEVKWVINFDMCRDAGAYTHRIGRTGRANTEGSAISFFTIKEQNGLLQYVQQDQKLKGHELVAFPRQADHWEKLRVRVEDVLDRITPQQVDKARVQFLAQEVLNSKQLKKHWKENPEDLKALSHLAKAKPDGMQYEAEYLHFMPSYMGLKKKDDPKEQPAGASKDNKKAAAQKANANAQQKDAKKKSNPFTVSAYEQAKKLERHMSDLELTVLDPEALRRRRRAKEQSARKIPLHLMPKKPTPKGTFCRRVGRFNKPLANAEKRGWDLKRKSVTGEAVEGGAKAAKAKAKPGKRRGGGRGNGKGKGRAASAH